MNEKEILINSIIEMELEMFLSVPAAQKSQCQEYPDSFRLHRRAQFQAWSIPALRSYVRDLGSAKIEGRNLMTYKYAQMENLLPCDNPDPLIDEIVRIQYRWQEEMFRKYPCLMKGARPLSTSEDSGIVTSFETYLRGELESYSGHTISLLDALIKRKLKRNVNMSEEVYEFLAREMGYKSLEEAERKMREREHAHPYMGDRSID